MIFRMKNQILFSKTKELHIFYFSNLPNFDVMGFEKLFGELRYRV